MMVRLRSKTTQITATISPFRADPGDTQYTYFAIISEGKAAEHPLHQTRSAQE